MTDLAIEPGGLVRDLPCPDCGSVYTRVNGFVYKGGDAHAVYYASCYHHEGHEVFIDAIFSDTWEDAADDHISFGCRVGPVGGQAEPAASLVEAGVAYPDRELFGQRLTREQALEHPKLAAFWELVDHVLTHDAVVTQHIYGREPGSATSHEAANGATRGKRPRGIRAWFGSR